MASFTGLKAVERAGFIAARSFSTNVVKASQVKAPVKVFGIEGRYAHALYSAAAKSKQLDKVETELEKLQGLLKTDPKLADFLKDPTLNKVKKQNTLQDAFKKLSFSDLTINLFGALAENNRLPLSGNVIKAYSQIMSAHRKEVPCVVTTAKALDAANMKELEQSLKSFVKPDETLKIETKIDPSIIGGMVVNIADKYVDMSISTKIKKITSAMEANLD
ncbi:mitochondrial ATP synthase subunit OSCP-like precursor [Paramuricea clavata]|uniref:Oligomycin sensitivity conferral protein n=1 Tax=Paramuricea clavata TaxID=317549 RepID=A0A6S7FRD5_PARCT|nr:mitochondrial ATP synthase subunit OSCP-like precursor [Paramuricea clavata]